VRKRRRQVAGCAEALELAGLPAERTTDEPTTLVDRSVASESIIDCHRTWFAPYVRLASTPSVFC